MNTKVSIIIPVYNAEKHLRRCVESVLKQDFQNFELILMNDGSTDSSAEICNEYKEKDVRVKVVHKENTGVSDTRNQAISISKGEYLQFLDSDDWITPDATGILVRMAELYQCEMVIADFYRVIGDRLAHKGNIHEDGILTREEFAKEMMENPSDFYYGVLWNKLYRRDIIFDHHIFMNENISWCEDFIFNMEYIRYVENVYVLHVPIYYYVKTPGSLVSQGMSISKTIQMKKTVFKCYKEFYKDIFDEDDYEKIQLQVYRFLIDSAGDGAVGPVFFPRSMKLGDERINVSFSVAVGEGLFFENYREYILLNRYLESVALKHNISLEDVKLMLFLSQTEEACTLKEISEITQIKQRKLLNTIQKLSTKEFIKLKTPTDLEKKKKKKVEWEILNSAEEMLLDLLAAKSSYLSVKYSGLTKDEIFQYELLNEKIKENIKNSFNKNNCLTSFR